MTRYEVASAEAFFFHSSTAGVSIFLPVTICDRFYMPCYLRFSSFLFVTQPSNSVESVSIVLYDVLSSTAVHRQKIVGAFGKVETGDTVGDVNDDVLRARCRFNRWRRWTVRIDSRSSFTNCVRAKNDCFLRFLCAWVIDD